MWGPLRLCTSYDATCILDSTSVHWCTQQWCFAVQPVCSIRVLVSSHWSPLCALGLWGGHWLFVRERLSKSPFWFRVARMPGVVLSWWHLEFPYWPHNRCLLFGCRFGWALRALAKVSLTCVAGPTQPLTRLSRHTVPTWSAIKHLWLRWLSQQSLSGDRMRGDMRALGWMQAQAWGCTRGVGVKKAVRFGNPSQAWVL